MSSAQQYVRHGSTGSDWTAIDASGLAMSITPTSNSLFVLSGNADLWTDTVGVNQDLGIVIRGGAYGRGVLIAWKESGGYAGTFSPNAAMVQMVVPLIGGTTYTVNLVWKANHATTGSFYAGAGLGPQFSPTSLTAQVTS
jgi:hypothetical protein